MSKVKIIKDIVICFNSITASLEALVEVLDNGAVTEGKEEKTPTSAKADTVKNVTNAETITLEKVRAVLAAKSKGGKQKEVKALITKYGGNKLTDLQESCYEQLLKEAEAL